MSKDQDFVDLVMVHGVPPQIIWVTREHVQRLLLHTSRTNVPKHIDTSAIR